MTDPARGTPTATDPAASDPGDAWRRRRFVESLAAGGLAALAGCGSVDLGLGGAATPTTTGGASGDGEATSGEGGAGPPTATATPAVELDLREANVLGVDLEPGDGRYGFAVELHHDDEGEDGYADRWQVETLDGTELGRRELTHAHGSEPFIRSATIPVPRDVTCVVVRGHDQTHGFGGRAMAVNLETQATEPVDQGPELQPIDDAACP